MMFSSVFAPQKQPVPLCDLGLGGPHLVCQILTWFLCQFVACLDVNRRRTGEGVASARRKRGALWKACGASAAEAVAETMRLVQAS